ncbi:MAG: DUF1453 family protein [Candidatus Eremiobacteraeota bacterium]|nr:DUF1453 family protein [Candidatus Eremiobacteraeota bacterium]
MQPWQTQTLITLAITAAIVIRFVRRELSARVVRSRTLWIRPVLLFLVLAGFVIGTLRSFPQVAPLLGLTVVAGAFCGAVTGLLVVRSTTFSPAEKRGAVRVHGSRVTAAVWIGALVLRLVARLLVPHSGLGVQSALNSGLIALVAVAFAIVAVAFHDEIRRFSSGATSALERA